MITRLARFRLLNPMIGSYKRFLVSNSIEFSSLYQMISQKRMSKNSLDGEYLQYVQYNPATTDYSEIEQIYKRLNGLVAFYPSLKNKTTIQEVQINKNLCHSFFYTEKETRDMDIQLLMNKITNNHPEYPIYDYIEKYSNEKDILFMLNPKIPSISQSYHSLQSEYICGYCIHQPIESTEIIPILENTFLSNYITEFKYISTEIDIPIYPSTIYTNRPFPSYPSYYYPNTKYSFCIYTPAERFLLSSIIHSKDPLLIGFQQNSIPSQGVIGLLSNIQFYEEDGNCIVEFEMIDKYKYKNSSRYSNDIINNTISSSSSNHSSLLYNNHVMSPQSSIYNPSSQHVQIVRDIDDSIHTDSIKQLTKACNNFIQWILNEDQLEYIIRQSGSQSLYTFMENNKKQYNGIKLNKYIEQPGFNYSHYSYWLLSVISSRLSPYEQRSLYECDQVEKRLEQMVKIIHLFK
ncbi:hypothetical protein WA158_007213 [Blastocystis sp. Blastoise]